MKHLKKELKTADMGILAGYVPHSACYGWAVSEVSKEVSNLFRSTTAILLV